MIDVSQSVEHDHPHALEFLRKDCTNINAFFQKNGVCTMTLKELFDFVVDPTINQENIEVSSGLFCSVELFVLGLINFNGRNIWIKWLN